MDHGYVNAGETPQDRVEEPNGVRPEETEPQPTKPTNDSSESKPPVQEQSHHNDQNITIYRGTSHGREIEVTQDSGYIMSDAARSAYQEARYDGASVAEALQAAQAAAEVAHANQLEEWGSLNNYIQAHGEWGSEINMFGPRSMISFTTDPDIAANYAGKDGVIFSTTVPLSSVIVQTLPGAGEAEVLVLFMVRL